jgi:hypothetical protein
MIARDDDGFCRRAGVIRGLACRFFLRLPFRSEFLAQFNFSERAGGAKSVFHFDVQGSVAKSTHAGIPWLRFIRQRLRERVHFWPFDGWDIPAGRSAIAEVYPALWSRGFANEDRTGDQHDAFSIAAWLSRADRDGCLAAFLKPDLSPPERSLALVEGWILGVLK